MLHYNNNNNPAMPPPKHAPRTGPGCRLFVLTTPDRTCYVSSNLSALVRAYNDALRKVHGDDVLLYDHLRLRRTAIYHVLSGRNKRGLYKFCTVTRVPQDTFVPSERCVRVGARG